MCLVYEYDLMEGYTIVSALYSIDDISIIIYFERRCIDNDIDSVIVLRNFFVYVLVFILTTGIHSGI